MPLADMPMSDLNRPGAAAPAWLFLLRPVFFPLPIGKPVALSDGSDILPIVRSDIRNSIGGRAMSMFIGEALAGEGNEIAHIDLLIGSKDGPVGTAFANALANQKQGHSNLLAILTPNLMCKPATVLITKVTIKGAGQAVQMFGPAQKAVARAVADSVAAGVIPKNQVEDLVVIAGVFIHWDAKDNAKIENYNYEATKLAIQRAMRNEPKIDEILAKKDAVKHPIFES
jgi:5,6,7,8-tetrahydromethanopterin hydro-lyase